MVSGSLRATDTLYSTTAQFNILRAPTASGGTTFGPGSANNLLKSNGTSIYWTTLAASDIPTISITDKTSGTLTVARGGTGATTTTGAITNLLGDSNTSTFYRGDHSWSNIIKQTSKAALGIDTNLKIGTARKDLNFDIGNGTGTGINDGYAGGITFGNGTSAYAGLYYQSSDSYGSRLLLATTGSYANGAYARMIITHDGKVGIGKLSPSTLLDVNGTVTATAFSGPLTGNVTGNVTGTLSTTRITLPGITGTGTVGADQGSSNTSTRYKPAVWTFSVGITPVDGDIITIKQPCAGHDYGTWLTLDNGTSYHPVVYNASDRITTHFTNGTSVTLCYDSNGKAGVFAVGGAMSRTTATGVWRVWNTYNTNNNDTGYYHRRIYPNLKAGGAIHPYSIIMQLPNGRWSGITTTPPTNPVSGTISPVATGKNASTSGYMLGHVLLMYARATYADGNNIATYNIWSAYTGLIDARYSFNLENSSGNGFTAYAPVYIVGSLNSSGLFILDSIKWWTQTLPSSDDGKIYIYIGDAYDWYRLTFTEDKPIYWYKNGKVQLYSGASTYSVTSGSAASVAWANITSKPLTLTAATTGFTIAGGTTSKTLTVSADCTLQAGSSTYLAYYNANNKIAGHGLAHFSDTYSSSTKNGKNEIVLGNATASTSNGSAYGQLALYSSGTKGTYLATAENNTQWYTATLPAASGTIAYTTSNITGTAANVTGTVAIEHGGTNATTAADARTNLGLGNVENTALSTWAGTSNITTVGTISTGTWQGTAIAASYIGSHSTDKLTSGTLPVARGGTGITTSTYKNAVLVGNSSTVTNAFHTIRTASGAFYATAQDGAPSFGTLPVAQGGTGQTSIANIKAGKDGDGNTISSTYLKLSGGTMTGNVTAPTFIGDLTGTASSSPKLTLQAGNVSSTSTDTYATNGLNIRWFSTAGCIPGQPSQYGFLLTAAAADSSKETHQIFMVQADGSLYHRGTNAGSYTNPPAFKTILDSANYTSYLVTASGTLGGLGSTFKDNSNPVNTRITRFNNVVTFTICGFHTKSSGSTEEILTNASIGLTIPDNFKPGKTVYMPVTGSNGTHYVLMILSTGAVNLSTLNGTIPANTWIYGSTSWIAGY